MDTLTGALALEAEDGGAEAGEDDFGGNHDNESNNL